MLSASNFCTSVMQIKVHANGTVIGYKIQFKNKVTECFYSYFYACFMLCYCNEFHFKL